MRTATAALQGLSEALDAPRVHHGSWRWSVRRRMAGVREVLAAETPHHRNEWLAARCGAVLRERNVLLGRLSALSPQVLECEAIDDVRAEAHRLLADIRHHIQRLHDLAYDDVELELGGSE